MKPSLVFKLIICLALVTLSVAALAASGSSPAKTAPAESEKMIDVQFSDTPLPIALDAMFKGTGKSYVLDPNLAQFRVAKAVLKNVSWETGLTQLLTAIGAAYYTGKDGVYHISMAPQQVMTQQNYYGMGNCAVPASAAPSAPAVSMGGGTTTQQPAPQVTTSIIDTKYINAAEAANAVANTPGVSNVSATNGNRVVIVATPEGGLNAAQVIAGLDTDKALPRPVRLKMTTKVTVGTVRGPKTYEAATESVGAEQAPVLLNLDTQEPMPQNGSALARRSAKQAVPPVQRTSLVNATVVPSINPDGRIGLVGNGRFTFPVGQTPGSEVSKDFGVAASLMPGRPFTVAAGSISLQLGRVDFAVTVTATPEEGRVYMSPSQSNVFRPVAPAPAASTAGPRP